MEIIKFVKDTPDLFAFIIMVIILMGVILPFGIYNKTIEVESEQQIIDDSSCHELKHLISNKEFNFLLNDAMHSYEWRCEK